LKLGEKGGERLQVACEEENEGKEWKLRKNRDLVDKKAFEDQLVSFCQFSLGALSLLSLSLSVLDT